MIILPIKKLRPGMITAQSIYNKKGGSYLTRGMPVTEQNIKRLKKIGVTHLTVTSMTPAFSVVPPEDIIQEKTRVKAIHNVYDVYQRLESTGELSPDSLAVTSEEILVDILSHKKNLVQLTDLRMHDDYTFAHSVNVAVLAAMLGAQVHLTKPELLTLITGGLLHDVGKIVVPSEILTKPSTLSDEEFGVIRTHPEAGRKKLHNLNMPSASILAAIAGQHHEHMDGRGYPNQLTGDKIHRFARIVAIADVYDALTTRRSYKLAYKPHIAYKIMTDCSPGQFDESLRALFFDNIAIYPVGTILKTTMGYAIVKKCEFGHTLTPIIRVFGDSNMRVLPEPFDVDLRESPPNTVSSVLEDMEIMSLLFRMQVDPAKFLQEQ